MICLAIFELRSIKRLYNAFPKVAMCVISAYQQLKTQ